MLKYKLTHPELIGALARMGHGSRVLITDANYAADVHVSPTATRIYLNLAPGMISATEILDKILEAIPVEFANLMLMDDGQEPPIASEYRAMLPTAVHVEPLARAEFYSAAKDSRTSVVVVTGEQRLFANILLRVGFINPDGTAHY